MSNEMDMFKDLFIQSAREHVQVLNDTLMKLEAEPEQLTLVEELMRAGHSLKGECAAMGYEKLATLAHVVEDLFTGIGNGSLKIQRELMDVLFSAFDHISQSVESIAASPEGKELDGEEFVQKIKQMTGLTTQGYGKSDRPATPSPTEEPPTGETPPPVDAPALPPAAPPPPSPSELAPTSVPPTEPAAPLPTSPSEPPPPSPAEPATSPETPAATDQISSVTLKVEKLDQMIGVSEELVLLKMQLKMNTLVQSNTQLKAVIHRLDRLVTDMQFHVMQARLFPISLALHTIPRLVRDTAHKTGKNVRLVMEGEETTVDRTIIDHLTEPFVHMVRNAIDHGIEAPEARKQAGKPEEATVRIVAYTRENKFYVDISDDGGGIEWKKLAKAAIKKGIFSEAQVNTWSDKDYEQLLFLDGVSASETVTDISGRGVGLDAVQKAIKKLGGSIQVRTVPGQGTTFTLRLPMTLAIMQALLVKVGKQTFALPGNEVIRSIQIDVRTIQSSGNLQVIAVDEEEVPLFDLKQLFAEPPSSSSASSESPEEKERTTVIVLVRQESRTVGCIVDTILAEEEILVKPLGPLLKNSTYFSGATILANGLAAPIINVEGLVWKA